MKFVFIRHGKPVSKDGKTKAEQDARPLAAKGKEDARRAAEFLRENGIVPDLVGTTMTARTKQTAKIVMETLEANCPQFAKKSGFGTGATPEDIHARVQEWIGEAKPKAVVFVGHNTQQSALVNKIGGPKIPADNRGAVLIYDVDKKGKWTVGPCFLGG